MTVSTEVDYDELFPGRFMKAGQFKGRDVTLKITDIDLELLPVKATGKEKGGKGGGALKEKHKGVLSFAETKLQLVLNRTNGECIKAMFGRKPSEWIGKRVTFYPAEIVSQYADIAIRVRGSPDLSQPVKFELRLPMKSPKEMTLEVTATGKGRAAAPAVPVVGSPARDGAPAGPGSTSEPPPPEVAEDIPGWNPDDVNP